VISYDLAWTADIVIQRAGRILRFWSDPRQVHLYVFVGRFEEYKPLQRESSKLESRLQTLTSRTRQAEKFSELPIIPDSDHVEYTSLGDLSTVTIDEFGLIDPKEVEEFSGVSRFLEHITELAHNQDYAATIPDDISSAMVFSQREPKCCTCYCGTRETTTGLCMTSNGKASSTSRKISCSILFVVPGTRRRPRSIPTKSKFTRSGAKHCGVGVGILNTPTLLSAFAPYI
jgi:hypothetical protein